MDTKRERERGRERERQRKRERREREKVDGKWKQRCDNFYPSHDRGYNDIEHSHCCWDSE